MQKIVIAVGLPGAGKSTWLARPGVNPISTDALRVQLADDVNDQTIHGRVFAAARYLLRQRLDLGRETTYIDATNLTRRDRKPWIRIAKDRGCSVEAVYFDVPLAVCKLRNAARDRRVPEDVLDRMALKLQTPGLEEGFDRITVVGAD